MNTTGEQLRRVNQVASAILVLLILAVLAGILWVSRLEGKPQAPGRGEPVPANLPANGQEDRPEALVPRTPGLEASPTDTRQVIPVPTPGQLDYLPPETISSPEPRSERAGEFDI